MDNKIKNSKLANTFWGAIGAGSALLSTAVVTFAANTPTGGTNVANGIFAKAKDMLGSLYADILGITTIIAVLCAVIALLMRMFSSNQKTVDTATQWLKRIVISWIIINTLGYFVNWLSEFTKGGQWNG